ncbi:MAG: N-acetyltransferase [Rectinemataceae bacterium]|nr:N-acetyltransferase [Spirochaetaceae bacterium]
MALRIRQETPKDYRAVENITRQAFWNLNEPGCIEHYLVHRLRSHPDCIPELDLVLEKDGVLVGSIMYTRSRLENGHGAVKNILTFGPVSMHPQHQRQGLGSMLIQESLARAQALGFPMVVIFGNPSNYAGLGFKSCSRYGICLEGGIFPTAMLVKELAPGALEALGNETWVYHESDAFAIDPQEAADFDAMFDPMEKKELPCQEVFYILSHSTIR